MVRTFLGFGAGSKQKDTGWPASEFWKLIWYFFSREGLLNNEPNSTNASFQIFSFSLSETRESMGKLADWKNCVGATSLVVVGNRCGSPEILAWAEAIAPFTKFVTDPPFTPGNQTEYASE